MKAMNITTTRSINGGKKIYYCPWYDYSNTSFWKTWGHAISCAYKRGYFNLPLKLIELAL